MILEIKHIAHGSSLQLILDTTLLHFVFWFVAAWQCNGSSLAALISSLKIKVETESKWKRDRKRATD